MRFLLVFCFLLLPMYANANEIITVEQSIQKTLKNNPLLQSALEGKESAEKQIKQAKSGYFPTIDLWASAGMAQEQNEIDRDRNLFSEPVFVYQGGVNLNQAIYLGGATTAQVESSEFIFESSQFAVLDTATNLVLETIIAHANVIAYKELLKIATDNYAAHKNLVTLLEERHKKGVIARGDFEQGYGKLKKSEISLLSSLEAYDLAKLNYKKITGALPSDNLQQLHFPANMYKEIQNVEAKALTDNYKIQELLAKIDSYKSQIDLADSGYLPNVNFVFNPAYTSKDVDDNDSILSWNADINVSWNVFRGFSDQAASQASNAEMRRAQQSLYDIKDALFLQIGTAYNQTVTAQKQLILFEAANVANINAKTNFYNQFRVGQKEVLQLLDIEREVYTTQAEYVIAELNLRLSHYRLHALAGTLLDEMNINTSALATSEADKSKTGESFSF